MLVGPAWVGAPWPGPSPETLEKQMLLPATETAVRDTVWTPREGAPSPGCRTWPPVGVAASGLGVRGQGRVSPRDRDIRRGMGNCPALTCPRRW